VKEIEEVAKILESGVLGFFWDDTYGAVEYGTLRGIALHDGGCAYNLNDVWYSNFSTNDPGIKTIAWKSDMSRWAGLNPDAIIYSKSKDNHFFAKDISYTNDLSDYRVRTSYDVIRGCGEYLPVTDVRVEWH